jgi:plastocyanin
MRRPFVIAAAVVALLMGAVTFGFAQESTPEMTTEGEACAAATPEASPMADTEDTAMASPEAEAVTMGTPEGGTTTGCTVAIQDFAFSPDTIEITAGTTVTWTNNDSAPHTVTSDDGAFDSGDLAQGDSVSLTFNEPGTYTYHCTYHPNMVGTIIVT